MKVYNQEKRIFETKEYVEKEDSGFITLLKGIKYRVKGGYAIIVFESDFVITTSEIWTHVATLPASVRPSNVVYFNLFTNAIDTRTVGVSVKPDGTINLLSAVGSVLNALGNVTYPI